MVDLVCTPFGAHVTRIHRELATQNAVFDLPRDKWYIPDPSGPDLSVQFHERRAATPAGPAAGPHGQMAQNIVLSYLAGGRIMELKTVQINDRLQIPRPCIDATNVGYNVEWSQELRLAESLHEYVGGAMLVEIIRASGWLTPGDVGPAFQPVASASPSSPAGDVIYDMSVGYDLAGIQSPAVREFIAGMLDARDVVDRLRMEIPAEHRALRDLDFPTRISDTITLSTFHGCPADEIERICEHLISTYGVGVIIKMNPPMLGRDALEHLLHDVMGYTEIRVNPKAYTSGLRFDESLDIVRRLDALAKTHGRRCGAKFSNTLEVVNHRDFFTPDNEVMYLSGAPLYVITLALTAKFRAAIGPDVPITFSAGIDQHNFADVVACGIKPVTVCTDLLRPGGYARLPKYLERLAADMTARGANTIDDYIRARCPDASVTDPVVAGWQNTTPAAEAAARDERYRAAKNRAVPKRINSHLVIFDCITCDKCIPVCPNDANFTYPLAAQDFAYTDFTVDAAGCVTPLDARRFVTEKSMQIANFADYCNECGNCDTFCPEYGGPFIEKPTFFSRRDDWARHADHDGFCVERTATSDAIAGRIQHAAYHLTVDRSSARYTFTTDHAEVTLDAGFNPVAARLTSGDADARIDMQVFHTLRLLLAGVLDESRINPINA
ncbi:MAG: glutamate synthase [Phycisphaerales bacterium]|nr:glutamate synthase [Phycisphaerales bacterium]